MKDPYPRSYPNEGLLVFALKLQKKRGSGITSVVKALMGPSQDEVHRLWTPPSELGATRPVNSKIYGTVLLLCGRRRWDERVPSVRQQLLHTILVCQQAVLSTDIVGGTESRVGAHIHHDITQIVHVLQP